jgi:diguanylate cyclase (GGDEF)-like protein
VLDAPVAPAVPALPRSSLDEALEALFTLGAGALHAHRCSLYLREDDGSTLTLRREKGLPPAAAAHSAVGETVMGLVLRTHVPLLVHNVASYPALPVHPERYATPSFLSVPILVENDALGVLNAADRQDDQSFTEDDLACAELVARSVAAVLHSDALARRARDEGEIDPVSGLYNVRHLHGRLAQEVERAQRAHLPLALLVLAVPGYADLAGRVGLQAAGALMRSVGAMVAQTVRQSDVLARRSDDEIAVLLPSTPLAKAQCLARTIAREVRHEKLPAQLRYDLDALDISIGLAAPGPSMDGHDLLRQAEEALAQARAHGAATVTATGGTLTAVRRRTPPRACRQAIATALRLGIPYLADPADAAAAAAVPLLSAEIARTYVCFPVACEAGTLTLALADPTDAGAIQAVSHVTQMAIYPVASPREKILQAIATLMDDATPQPGRRVRLHIPPMSGLQGFVRHLTRLVAVAQEPPTHALTVEGTVAVQLATAQDRDALRDRLAAIPDLRLYPDKREGGLLHLAVGTDE